MPAGPHRPLSNRVLLVLLAVAFLLATALLAAGCGSEPDDTTGTGTPDGTTGATQTTAPDGTTPAGEGPVTPAGPPPTVSVYFSYQEKVQPVHRPVDEAGEPARAAVELLLQGPSAEELEMGLSSSVPEDTELLGLAIRDGVATVDLSRAFESGGGSLSMQMRLAQLVYTLTQFPTVERVALHLDGVPAEALGGEGIQTQPPRSRTDMEDMTPRVLVESPAMGDAVTSPLRVWGTANTFEATFQLEVTDWDGRIIAEQMVTATSGSGERGTFDVTVPYDIDRAGNGALVVFEISAEDGSRVDLIEIPLQLEP